MPKRRRDMYAQRAVCSSPLLPQLGETSRGLGGSKMQSDIPRGRPQTGFQSTLVALARGTQRLRKKLATLGSVHSQFVNALIRVTPLVSADTGFRAADRAEQCRTSQIVRLFRGRLRE